MVIFVSFPIFYQTLALWSVQRITTFHNPGTIFSYSDQIPFLQKGQWRMYLFTWCNMKHSESCISTMLASGLKHPLIAWDAISKKSLLYQCLKAENACGNRQRMFSGGKILVSRTLSNSSLILKMIKENIKYYIRVESKEILGFICELLRYK